MRFFFDIQQDVSEWAFIGFNKVCCSTAPRACTPPLPSNALPRAYTPPLPSRRLPTVLIPLPFIGSNTQDCYESMGGNQMEYTNVSRAARLARLAGALHALLPLPFILHVLIPISSTCFCPPIVARVAAGSTCFYPPPPCASAPSLTCSCPPTCFYLLVVPQYYAWKITLPMLTCTLFCFSSLFFETDNLTDRNATSATMFLATMALLYVIASSTPRTPQMPRPASRLAAHTLDYSSRPMHSGCSPSIRFSRRGRAPRVCRVSSPAQDGVPDGDGQVRRLQPRRAVPHRRRLVGHLWLLRRALGRDRVRHQSVGARGPDGHSDGRDGALLPRRLPRPRTPPPSNTHTRL